MFNVPSGNGWMAICMFQGIPCRPRITRVSQIGIDFEDKSIFVSRTSFLMKLRSKLGIGFFDPDIVEIHVTVRILGRCKPPLSDQDRIRSMRLHQTGVYC